MLAETPAPEQIISNVQFHDVLNPNLWDGTSLRLDVRVNLLEIAKSFLDYIDMKFEISDVIITGSNVNYNYTRLSDIDVHLVTSYSDLSSPDVAAELFAAKKRLWALEHNIKIFGHDVELYVENADEPAESAGIYSLLRGQWIKQPSREEPNWNDNAIVQKVNMWVNRIDGLVSQNADVATIDQMLERLRKMRQSGLETGGEFSTENLTFKCLRALGYIDVLYQKQAEMLDQQLTLEALSF